METAIGQCRSSGRTVAAVLVAALWLRALVPGGFMPIPSVAGDGAFTLGLCRGVLADTGPSKAGSKQAGICVFLAMASLTPPELPLPLVTLPLFFAASFPALAGLGMVPLRPQRGEPEARAPPLDA